MKKYPITAAFASINRLLGWFSIVAVLLIVGFRIYSVVTAKQNIVFHIDRLDIELTVSGLIFFTVGETLTMGLDVLKYLQHTRDLLGIIASEEH